MDQLPIIRNKFMSIRSGLSFRDRLHGSDNLNGGFQSQGQRVVGLSLDVIAPLDFCTQQVLDDRSRTNFPLMKH